MGVRYRLRIITVIIIELIYTNQVLVSTSCTHPSGNDYLKGFLGS